MKKLFIGKVLEQDEADCGFCGEKKQCMIGYEKVVWRGFIPKIAYRYIKGRLFATSDVIYEVIGSEPRETKASSTICEDCATQISTHFNE